MYVLYAVILTAIMWVIWNKTTFGKNMFAVGSNEEAANVSGVNVTRTIIMVFVLGRYHVCDHRFHRRRAYRFRECEYRSEL